jgi:hypothetical protein
MALTIALIIVAMLVITALELWVLWALGERDDRRTPVRRARGRHHQPVVTRRRR